MSATDDCAAILLAAGASTRLGQPKQLVQIEGETLLRRTTRLAIESACSPVFVVLGGNAASFLPEIRDLRATVLLNNEWRSGMASSLKLGINAALAANPQMRNILALVCDQPRLDPPLLQSLLATHRSVRNLISASQYGETLGVPAIFSRDVFPELLALTGDQGARKILLRHRENVAAVPFPGGDFDLDTPEDLARLNS
jgi:molybdenum cofactor cytidylyltransferase